MLAEGLVEGGEALAQAGGRVVGQPLEHVALPRARLLDHAVEECEEHGLLGGEVEVERGPGDARAACQVVDGYLAQGARREQALGRLEDRALAVVARGTGRAATARGAGGGGF